MSTKSTVPAMRILSALLIMVLSVGPLGTIPAHAAGILHVTPDGGGDCSNWANACALQTALTNAVSGDEIWVQAGVYKPTIGTDRAATFQLKGGVAVYGGFAGTESTRSERDFMVNITTLSGDLLGNDNDIILAEEPTRADNSYHVVTGASGAILDGFTVKAGNANGSPFPNDSGGGFLDMNSGSILTNILFFQNTTSMGGGGMFSANSVSVLTNVIFRENYGLAGGGMYTYGPSNNPTLTKVTFDGNSSATNGGGMFVGQGNFTLTDVAFIGNTADIGGGLYNESEGLVMNNITFFNNLAVTYGGGMTQSWFGHASLTNATFADNSAENGGGLANFAHAAGFTMTNITFSGNTADTNGGGVYNDYGYVVIHNTILWGNTDLSGLQVYDTGIVTINDSVIQGECSIYSMCSNIITEDPLLGTLGYYGGFTQTIPIETGSSAIDATSNNCPATDQRGLPRSNPACDIGAYELQTSNVLYAAPGGLPSGTCSSWAEACDLQYALTHAVSGQEIWVQAGVYKPTTGTDRAVTFQLKGGVAVYGGFAGTESARNERDFTVNVTTLSGDLLGNDNDIILPDEPTRADNSYNVLIGTSGAILDGFTVTAGNANGDAFPGAGGGGLFELYGGSILINILFLRNTSTGGGGIISLNSDTVLTDVTFRENNAVAGGGMYTYSPTNNPTLTRVIFDNNSSATNGGGMFIGQGNFTLTDAVFINNSANMGGGLYNEAGGLVMNNIAFSDNSAVTYGGGMMQSTYGKVSLANATFAENSAQNGGGFANFSSYKHDPSTLTNITFTGNTAKTDGGGIYNSSWSIIRNTILWGNTDLSGLQVYDNVNATISDSVVEGECSIYTICTNITTDDPLLGTLGDYGGFTQTIPIQAGSSAIDATSNNCPATDQRGLLRSNPTCDIGAYELQTSNVLYATPNGLTFGVCSSWAEACNLQYALTNAVSGQEIWVQAGVYKPTTGTDRAATFQLKSGVAVYGGFTGTESARDQRNFGINVTTLSGDLLGNDNDTILPDEPTHADNSYHVVTGASGAILDGFTVAAGNANGTSFPDDSGGGLFEFYGGSILTNILFFRNTSIGGGGMLSVNSDAILTDIIFRENNALSGGGLGSFGGDLIMTRVTFDDNSSTSIGGGMVSNQGNLSLTDVTFVSNTADMGGGLYNQSDLAMNNITFFDNSAVTYGGGMMNRGQVTLTNATFAGNSADNGGGIADTSNRTSILTNVTFNGNTAKTNGGAVYNLSSYVTIRNSILWDNTDLSGFQAYGDGESTISNSVLQGSCSIYSICTNIITDDPLLGVLGDYGGFTQTIPIEEGSSAIDATSNNCPVTDQRGVSRSNPVCDIGAYETQPSDVLYATPGGLTSGDCSDWANACALQTALTNAVSGDEIWVQMGVHKPTSGTDRTATFQLKGGVAVYGGFAGTESARNERDFTVNITTLSGDLLGNDNSNVVYGEPTRADNSYHVVTGATGAILDGFIVAAGNANGTTDTQGGGLYNSQSDTIIQNVTFSENTAELTGGGMHNQQSNPIVSNVIFITNWAGVGGGMFNDTSSPILTDVQFIKNSAYLGGGMRNMYDSSPSLTRVIFSQNSAGVGGGMGNYLNSNPILTDVIFVENTSTEWAGLGGGMHNEESSPILTNVTFDRNVAIYGGGIRNDQSSPTLINVTFSGNSATSGGGEYDFSSSPAILNSTFTGNSATNQGGGLFNTSLPFQIDNTILWGNAAPNGGPQIMSYGGEISNTILEGGCPEAFTCTNVITTDPKLGVLGDYGGFTQTIPLLEGSSAIDSGSDSVCPATDQRGVTRPQGLHCDIGAFEYSPATFTDVPSTYWAWNFIERLYNAGITGGCSTSPLMYCPETSVTRAQMAVFLLRGIHGSAYNPPDATGTVFTDVPSTYWAAAWIEQLYAEGITGGCGNGNYCPDMPVTRDQMAVFLLRAEHGSAYTPPTPTGVFTDVPTDHWAAAWIEQLATEGITGGCGSGIYCPVTIVNRAQMAVFLVRTFNLP